VHRASLRLVSARPCDAPRQTATGRLSKRCCWGHPPPYNAKHICWSIFVISMISIVLLFVDFYLLFVPVYVLLVYVYIFLVLMLVFVVVLLDLLIYFLKFMNSLRSISFKHKEKLTGASKSKKIRWTRWTFSRRKCSL
jgi:hypothetical protein